MNKTEILDWLREEDADRLSRLWERADTVRKESVGDGVHLRGLIEFSNHCVRQCGYCGLRAGNRAIERYRMSVDEIMECAREATLYGYGTVVLQSGEDPAITREWVADTIRKIKEVTNLAITLSLGEREEDDLLAWREAGADRYLLRFETSNEDLYRKIHPSLPGKKSDRIALLRRLKEIGYEAGGGVMIGIPGQTWDDLANDILMFRELDLDMIGVGPYIPHPGTPLGQSLDFSGEDQVPGTELMTLKTVALARLMCPYANIPSTTALATLDRDSGRELGLMRGANVVMPNLTPTKYRALYEIYPAKVCIDETAKACRACLTGRILSIGRTVSRGRGDSLNYRRRVGGSVEAEKELSI